MDNKKIQAEYLLKHLNKINRLWKIDIMSIIPAHISKGLIKGPESPHLFLR